MSPRRLRALTVVLVPLTLLPACADDSTSRSGNGGDCNASIGVGDTVYVFDTAVDQTAPQGEAWKQGTLLDCDGTPLEPLDLHVLVGVDTRVAIAVVDRRDASYDGIYVNRVVPASAWPSELLAPSP